jgi:glycosyltransferase involved in cell wall biosynthesis
MMLSVVVPVYNEYRTLGQILAATTAALSSVPKQIIVVDDCSTDGTREWLRANFESDDIECSEVEIGDDGNMLLFPADGAIDVTIRFRVIYHDKNIGKGGALRTGFREVIGDVVVIQDADLEYDPADWEKMYRLITERQVADVVFGSRFFGSPHRALYYHHYLGNRLISVVYNLLYNQMLSDLEVCYKMMRREVLQSLNLSANDFGIEIQISAQIALARKWRIYEVGISYFGRTYAEGKKIDWKDGVKALWLLIKYRVRFN